MICAMEVRNMDAVDASTIGGAQPPQQGSLTHRADSIAAQCT